MLEKFDIDLITFEILQWNNIKFWERVLKSEWILYKV